MLENHAIQFRSTARFPPSVRRVACNSCLRILRYRVGFLYLRTVGVGDMSCIFTTDLSTRKNRSDEEKAKSKQNAPRSFDASFGGEANYGAAGRRAAPRPPGSASRQIFPGRCSSPLPGLSRWSGAKVVQVDRHSSL